MEEFRDRVERFIREHELIPLDGEVTCLVSGGADSTCLWHVLGSLGYRVSALHVNHKLRGADSDEDARFCAEVLEAEVVELDGRGLSEAALREQRRSVSYERVGRAGLRATGHTASDQVETILYRLVARGAAAGSRPGASMSASGCSAARSSWPARSAGASGLSARSSKGLECVDGGPATDSQAGGGRSRTCSSTRRCRARTAMRGPSSCAVTRS